MKYLKKMQRAFVGVITQLWFIN